MDGEELLHIYADLKSQETQLLENIPGLQINFGRYEQMKNVVLEELNQRQYWRWDPVHGLAVGIPQDKGRIWRARELAEDIRNRVRHCALPNGDPDPNGHRALHRQEYTWLLAQLLHYGLGFAQTRRDASALLARALLNDGLKQPAELVERGQGLKQQYLSNRRLSEATSQGEITAVEGKDEVSDNNQAAHAEHLDNVETGPAALHQVVGIAALKLPVLSEKIWGKQRAQPLGISQQRDIEHGLHSRLHAAGRDAAQSVSTTSMQAAPTLPVTDSTTAPNSLDPVPQLQDVGEGQMEGNHNRQKKGLQRRVVNTSQKFAACPTARSIFSIPRDSPACPNRLSDRQRSASGGPSRLDVAFPVAKKTTRLPSAKVKDKSTTKSTSSQVEDTADALLTGSREPDPQNKRHENKARSRIRRSSPAAASIDGSEILMSGALGYGDQPSGVVDQQGGRESDQVNSTRPEKEDDNSPTTKRKKATNKKSSLLDSANRRSEDRTGIARISEDPERNVGNPKAKPLKPSSASTTTNMKGKSAVLHLPLEAPPHPRSAVPRMVSLPASSVSESPVPAPKCSRKSKRSKKDKRPFNVVLHDLLDTLNGITVEFRAVHDDLRVFSNPAELLDPILDTPGIPSPVANLDPIPGSPSSPPSTKRDHSAAFEEGEVTQGRKKTERSKPQEDDPLIRGGSAVEQDLYTGGISRSNKKSKESKHSEQTDPAESVLQVLPEAYIEAKQTNPKDISANAAPLGKVVHGRKMRYVMGCDENGIPAKRPEFRRSVSFLETHRDQIGRPIPRDAVIRNEPPLHTVLANDPETQRIGRGALAERRKRGGLDRRTPERSGNVLEAPKPKKARKRNETLGKGAYHKRYKSSKMPPSKLR